jgi:hypothetical protein
MRSIERAARRVRRIFDRGCDIRGIALAEIRSRSPGDLSGRDPGSLDMATFLASLADRRAVIELPGQRVHNPVESRRDEHFLSGPRNGRVLGVVSNAECFQFSLRILDQSVVRQDDSGVERQGFPRNHTIVGADGEWHPGWRSVMFWPSASEEPIVDGQRTVEFRHFVSPSRSRSLLSAGYIILAAIERRIMDEVTFLRWEEDRILKKGIRYRAGEGPEPSLPVSIGPSERRKVETLHCEVDFQAPVRGSYWPVQESPDGLEESRQWRNKLLSLRTRIRYHMRLDEYAFWIHRPVEGLERGVAWIAGEWLRGVTTLDHPRTKWSEIVLLRGRRGLPGISLRIRKARRSVSVAAPRMSA